MSQAFFILMYKFVLHAKQVIPIIQEILSMKNQGIIIFNAEYFFRLVAEILEMYQ